MMNHLCLLLFLLVLGVQNITVDAMADEVMEIVNPKDYQGCLQLAHQTFTNEVADTPKKMQKGLMFRQSLPENASMLFIFPQSQQANFWMKNTLIPLDMLFFDENRVLREIKNDIPPCITEECPIYQSISDNIRFVLEVSAGTVRRLNLHPGEKFNACP